MMETIEYQITAESFLEAFYAGSQSGGLWNEKAIETLLKQGLPEVKNEKYKYSNILKELNRHSYQISNRTEAKQFTTLNVNEFLPNYSLDGVMVTVNGHFAENLSQIPTQISVLNSHKLEKSDQHLLDLNDSMVALNTLMADRGFLIDIRTQNRCKIFWLDFFDSEETEIINIKNHVVIAADCYLEIHHICITLNQNPLFCNTGLEVTCNQNSHFKLHQIQRQNLKFSSVNHVAIGQFANSRAEISQINLGGNFTRNNIRISHWGTNCESKLNGLSLVKPGMKTDSHTLIEHLEPHCQSDEMYKNIVAGNGTVVFNGKVYVAPKAQKTNAYQSNKNLLLSDESRAYSKPELEIYADDVKCSHGSTTGQSDEDALFYLRARGIKELTARKLLMLAFANDLLERIDQDELADYLKETVLDHFESLIQEA